MTVVELFTESIINIINDAQDNDLNIEFIRDKISIDFKDEFMEIEKIQIMNAWNDVGTDGVTTAEQYYNETFKSE